MELENSSRTFNRDAAVKVTNEANRLFAAKNHQEAAEKFSDAINLYNYGVKCCLEDLKQSQANGELESLKREQSILYSSLSACFIALEEYVRAHHNALTATELDPSNSKAWGRRATAMMKRGNAASAAALFHQALSLLPSQGLTKAQKAQKQQLTKDMEKAKKIREQEAFLRGEPAQNFSVPAPPGQLPWERVYTEEGKKLLLNPRSSGWTIVSAWQALKKAGEVLSQRVEGFMPDGRPGKSVTIGGVSWFSNALMNDIRITQCLEFKRYFLLYGYQEEIEFKHFGATSLPQLTPELVLSVAQTRLKARGWVEDGRDSLRNCLQLTIRGWIMRGVVSNAVNPAKDYVGSVLWFKAAVDLIVLGREAWKDVHREVRGSVFQRSFLLGARRLYLEAYINAYMGGHADNEKCEKCHTEQENEPPLMRPMGGDTNLTLEGLKTAAEELLRDYDEAIAAGELIIDVKEHISMEAMFYMWPRSTAYGSLARYHTRNACNCGHLEWDNCAENVAEAVRYFTASAKALPVDDEQACIEYIYALDVSSYLGYPACFVRNLIHELRSSSQRMHFLWEYLPSAQRDKRDERIRIYLEAGDKLCAGMDSGSVKATDLVVLVPSKMRENMLQNEEYVRNLVIMSSGGDESPQDLKPVMDPWRPVKSAYVSMSITPLDSNDKESIKSE